MKKELNKWHIVLVLLLAALRLVAVATLLLVVLHAETLGRDALALWLLVLKGL